MENFWKFLAWLKTTKGITTMTIVGAMLVILFFAWGKGNTDKVVENAAEIKSNVSDTVGKAVVFEENTLAPVMSGVSSQTHHQQQQQQQYQPRAVLPTTLYQSAEKSVGADYAPFGRLIKCQLVITVDSAKIETPIVAQVIEDVWHEGRLIVNAGVEVHGMAQVDRARDRISAQNKFTLVWRFPNDAMNGYELPLNGIVLAHLPEHDEHGWKIIDGSAGLPGDVIKSDKWAELKEYVATFIQGAASGFVDQQMYANSGGVYQSYDGNLKNAAAKAFQNAADRYAQDMLEAIRRDGFFVRVPAGTTFYLYVTQTIDLADAAIGASNGNNTLANTNRRNK
ncbi:MAG: TrbI/VirB10 family protein [Verrucomicrobiales bacterium]|jgi:hypothetical protein|nr:TrbI/VirB10 family protein [Verrucomicrobiales bacterium]